MSGALAHSASWVIRKRSSGEVVFETFSRQVAASINTTAYEVVPIAQHLAEINREIGWRQRQGGSEA